MSTPQINALINLIEDPDPAIYNQVKSEIVAMGEEVIPDLERYWELHDYGQLFQERLESLIHSIQYDSVTRRIEMWRDDEHNDLLEGAILVNKFNNPSLDEAEVRRMVARIRQDVWLELNDSLTAMEIVNIFNHILYNVHGFEGNKNNYTAPGNSFIGEVLETRKGNPLSLALLYRVLAESLDIPIYGVNLPNHFILAYVDESAIHPLDDEQGEHGVLFYINPFTGGTMIHRNEIDEFLNYLNLPQQVRFYRPCANRDIIGRMVDNLAYAYAQIGKQEKVDDLKMLQGILRIGTQG